MRVYSPKGDLDGKHERLAAAIPTIAGRGRSLGVGDFVDIDIDADSHADAVKLVRQAFEAVLDPDDVDRIIDADHPGSSDDAVDESPRVSALVG